MFREQLKRDLDGISPDEELLSKISAMMTEEAKKPKQPVYMNVAKWGGMAAAICLIAVGATAFLGNGGNNLETTAADTAGMAADSAAYEPPTETTAAAQAADMADYVFEDAADYEAEMAAEEYYEETADFAEDDSIAFSESAVTEETYSSRFADCNLDDVDIYSIQFNQNPDLSKKAVPEGYANSEYTEPAYFEELVREYTDIVIVKITDIEEYAGQSFTGDAELDEILEEKWQSDSLTGESTLCFAQAESIVSSDYYLAGDIIPVFMPDGNLGATLEKDKYYLLVLEDYKNGVCKLYNGAESVFEIMDDNTVISQSCFRTPSMFDGLTVYELAAVLKYEKEPKSYGLR